MLDIIIKNIGSIVTAHGNAPLYGKQQGKIKVYNNASIGIKNGIIEYVGDSIKEKARKTFNANGALVTSGLIDCHTHFVYGGSREDERYNIIIDHMSYSDIIKSGYGILSTVRDTRNQTENSLYKKSIPILDKMLQYGTTTVEGKSGYGLTVKDEIKILKVMKKLNDNHKIDIVSTFMGGHVVPDEYKNDRASYINLICNEMIPKISKLGIAEFCDVFCENCGLDMEETDRVLDTAKSYNLGIKVHSDQLETSGGSYLAARFNAISAEHLIMSDDRSIDVIKNQDVIAVLLPNASFYLNMPYARARYMIDKGVPIALATDYNPGSSPSFNMQFIMKLAYIIYRLKPEEILNAVTINAACAINRGKEIGSIEVGKKADIIVWNCNNLNFLLYSMDNNLCRMVFKSGELVYHN
ncbi:imidazolonepropionase [Brachyspira hampsonii]|uniref:Imidazolonepropionase n=1 Tax=Brachyspira hampsonii 30446 TaxID=1289135 RepID=A0A2U4F0Y4_9SPIR|nr:imidazolonepropionase [Brachyspira hampsonii]EKV56739.1 imidazolonepropionase [Brachyspira hampsonii 30446]MBW5390746.1 imidazolonepropionase [Brachyspira hampsonii]MBW5394536.1 imidazolonepropionase [Brachyspira hampsonii]OEJ17632.1 imidazolonepropionase [Brachyspira hampsonii]